MNRNSHEMLKKHLQSLEVDEIANNIRNFRRSPLKHLTDNQLANEISKVLSKSSLDGNTSISHLTVQTSTYPIQSKFYRVRVADSEDRNFPLKCMSIENDLWTPPIDRCRQGRLNKVNEAILYTSPSDPTVAFEEMQLSPDHLCCLIVYTARAPIKVSVIGGEAPPGLTAEEKLKLDLLNDFLHDEFTREVGENSSHLYRISELIAKTYFDLPPDVQDAWCYPSVAKKPQMNVAFRVGVAKKLLKPEFVLLGHRDGHRLNAKIVAEWDANFEKFHYHTIGSEEQKRLVPEITAN